MDNKILNNSNLKNTKNRSLILSKLSTSNSSLCAEELYNLLDKKINMATIYRNLNTLTDKSILTKVTFDDGKIYYKFNNSDHTHYLICNICHSISPITNCPIDIVSKNIEKDTGYKITNHFLELRGICPNCKKELS